MGRDKLLLPFGEGTVLSSVVDSAVEAGFSPVIVVTSPKIANSLTKQYQEVVVMVNDRSDLGQSFSLRLGIQGIGKNSDFCILLGDMPMVKGRDLLKLLHCFSLRPTGKTALMPLRDGRFGHPSLYEAVWKERFRKAEGDIGGRNCVRKFTDEVLFIEGEDNCFVDVDTPEDYQQLQENCLRKR
jgi:molybdenum cofactor cytidylyltransferase